MYLINNNFFSLYNDVIPFYNISNENIMKFLKKGFCRYKNIKGKNKNKYCGRKTRGCREYCFQHYYNINKQFINKKPYNTKCLIKKKITNYVSINYKININHFKYPSSPLISFLYYDINIRNMYFFKFKNVFIISDEIYQIIYKMFNIYNNNMKLIEYPKNKTTPINVIDGKTNEQIKKVEYQIPVNLRNVKKRKKTKTKKIVNFKNNVNTNDIKEKFIETLCIFNQIYEDEVFISSQILFSENKQLFNLYIRIILSNINLFFKDVNIDILNNIWKDIVIYEKYDKVILFSNIEKNKIIEEVFSYVRNNFNLIPDDNKLLWINNNNIVLYHKKYNIEKYNNGIKIYSLEDTGKNNPLQLNKLIILYY